MIFVQKNLKNKYLKDKKYCKVRDHCHYIEEYGEVLQRCICNSKYSVPKKAPIVFHMDQIIIIILSSKS